MLGILHRACILKNLYILQEWVRKDKVENSSIKCIFQQKNAALMNYELIWLIIIVEFLVKNDPLGDAAELQI